MTTLASAFAAVASVLAGVDSADTEAVEGFYGEAFTRYPPRAQALIADFLVGLSDQPTEDELQALKATVALPDDQLPEIEAPARPEKLPVLRSWGGSLVRRRMIDAHIGTRIRLRRTNLHITTEQLSVALGLTAGEMRECEDGSAGLPAAMLQDVSRVLGVPVGFFFENLPESSIAATSRGKAAFWPPLQPDPVGRGGFAEPHAPPPAPDTDDLELLHAYEAISSPADRRRALALVSGLRSARP